MSTQPASASTPTRAGRGARRVTIVAMVAWGLLHVFGGTSLLITAARDGATAGLESLTSRTDVPEVPGQAGVLTEAVLVFLAIVLILAGVAVAVLALTRVRAGWPIGIATALGIVAVLDAALVVALLIPGHVALADGVWGPALLAVAGVGAWSAGWRPGQ